MSESTYDLFSAIAKIDVRHQRGVDEQRHEIIERAKKEDRELTPQEQEQLRGLTYGGSCG